jgi:PAS domain S-box-containing protein
MQSSDGSPVQAGDSISSLGRRALVPLAFAIYVGGVLILGATIHRQARDADHRAATENLVATAQLSALAVDTWVTERRADAEAISTSELLVAPLMRIEAGKHTAADMQAVQNHLNTMRRLYSYSSIALLHAHRKDLVLTNGRPLDPEQREVISRLDAYRKPLWVELPVVDPSQLRLGLVRGVAGSGSVTPWLLYLEIEPEWLTTALKLAHPRNWAGSSLLLHRDRTGVRYLTSDDGPRLQSLSPVQMPVGKEARPRVEGLLFAPDAGQREGVNRNGEEVIARAEPVQLPGWVLYSELPISAVYIARERTRILVLGMGALLLLGTLAMLAWRRGDRHKAHAQANRMRRNYESILRNSAEIFVMAHSSGKILDANHAAAAAYGYTRSMMIGMQAKNLRIPGSTGAELVEGLEPGEVRPFQEERLRVDGTRFLLDGAVCRFDQDGDTFYVNIGRDITRNRAIETRMRVAASFFERSAAGIVLNDSRRIITGVNPAVTKITGHQAEELIGQPTNILNAGLEPEVIEVMLECLAREDHWEGEMRGRRKDGSVYPARVLVSAYRNEAGDVAEHVTIISDLSKLRRAEMRAEHLAHHDQLTGLPNRAMLDRELPERIRALDTSQRAGVSVTVCLLNLDRFKAINESLGQGCVPSRRTQSHFTAIPAMSSCWSWKAIPSPMRSS